MSQPVLKPARRAFIAALLIAASCSSGGGSRTVTGAFEVTHWFDDGSKTTLREAPFYGWVLTGIHIPDDSGNGYTTRAVSLDANQAFSIHNVPGGSYFVELDAPI